MELNQQPRRGKTGAVKHLYANAVDKLTSPKPEIKKLRKDFMSIMEHMVLTSPVMQDKQNVRKDTYSIFPQLFIRPDSLVQLFYLQSNASSLCLLPSTPKTTTLLDSIVIKVFKLLSLLRCSRQPRLGNTILYPQGVIHEIFIPQKKNCQALKALKSPSSHINHFKILLAE